MESFLYRLKKMGSKKINSEHCEYGNDTFVPSTEGSSSRLEEAMLALKNRVSKAKLKEAMLAFEHKEENIRSLFFSLEPSSEGVTESLFQSHILRSVLKHSLCFAFSMAPEVYLII
ncbi:unnamed protein product [Arabis nemorensis]|uniref:Uncharacterized protein n=1 Tax=Arabis nemorensis TaxID=586526 RepID=A0A565C5M7_9BRAS|nr:unnamed protein product [Arabis nemorensis]